MSKIEARYVGEGGSSVLEPRLDAEGELVIDPKTGQPYMDPAPAPVSNRGLEFPAKQWVEVPEDQARALNDNQFFEVKGLPKTEEPVEK